MSDTRKADLMHVLLQLQASADSLDVDQETPLLFAVRNGDLETAKVILEYATKNFDTCDKEDGRSILGWAVFNRYQLVEKLLSYPINKHIEDNDGYTPLMLALDNDDTDIVDLLVKKPDDIQASLLCAVKWGFDELLQKLLIKYQQMDGDSHCIDGDGNSLFILAAQLEDTKALQITSMLFDQMQVDSMRVINLPDKIKGWAALSWACNSGNVKLIESLIEHGADINHSDHDGLTPLMLLLKKNRSLLNT